MWSRLIFKEILQRKWGFLFSILAVAVAVAAWMLVESVTASLKPQADRLKADADRLQPEAERLKADAEKLTVQADRLRDQAGKMKAQTDRMLAEMQQNLMIVPEAVREDQYYMGDFGDCYLPQWLVPALVDEDVVLWVDTRPAATRTSERLQWMTKDDADRRFLELHKPPYIKTHALPNLADHYTAELQARRQAAANGQAMDVILTGQLQEKGRKSSRPLVVPAAPGKAHVGSGVARSLKLKAGDSFQIAGKSFVVDRVEAEQATHDDVRVYLALADAQAILNKPGLINRVLALSCQCEGVTINQLAEALDNFVRNWAAKDHARTAGQPATQSDEPLAARVTPMTRIAVARDNVRAAIEAQAEAIKTQRESVEHQQTLVEGQRDSITSQWRQIQQLYDSIRGVAAALMPLLGLIVAALVGGYFYFNVRERQQEMGVLLAIGFSPRPIILAILFKLALVSLLGGAIGTFGGIAVAGQLGPMLSLPHVVLPWHLWPVAMGGAIVLTLLAGVYPLVVAARTEAATILRNT